MKSFPGNVWPDPSGRALLALLDCAVQGLSARAFAEYLSLGVVPQEEGKAEAAAYDKFACFCKDTADAKLYSITKGHETTTLLTAAIEYLASEFTELAAEKAATRQEISNIQFTMEAEQAARDSEFAQFSSDDNDLQA